MFKVEGGKEGKLPPWSHVRGGVDFLANVKAAVDRGVSNGFCLQGGRAAAADGGRARLEMAIQTRLLLRGGSEPSPHMNHSCFTHYPGLFQDLKHGHNARA